MVSKKTKLFIAASLVTCFNIGLFFSINIKQYLADRFLRYFSVTPKDVEQIEANCCTTSTIMSIFTGILIKKWSPSKVCILANLLLFLVSIAVYIGVEMVDFNTLLILAYARGIAIEGIFLAQATLTVDLFAGQVLSLILGLIQVANSVSSAASNYLTPKIFKWTRDLPFCYFTGSVVSLFGLVLAVGWWVLEGRGWGKEISLEVSGKALKEKSRPFVEEDGGVEVNDLNELFDRDEGSGDVGGRIMVKESPYTDLWDLNIWLNCMNYGVGTTSDVIFASFANELFVRRFSLETEQAGTIMSIILLLTIPFTPLYSSLSIKYGLKPQMLILAYISAALSFFYLAMLPSKLDSLWSLAIPIFGYSQYLSVSHFLLYTNIGLVSSKRVVSVSFGISSLIFGVIYISETQLFGQLLKPDTVPVYQQSLFVMVALFAFGAALSLLVLYIDIKRGKVLYLPENCEEAMKVKKRIDRGYLWVKRNYLGKNASKSVVERATIANSSVAESKVSSTTTLMPKLEGRGSSGDSVGVGSDSGSKKRQYTPKTQAWEEGDNAPRDGYAAK